MTISVKASALCAVASLLVLGVQAQLSPAETRGEAIYFGEDGSALDAATAAIGTMNVELPASSFPCASCHGERGQGRAERGVAPSDLSRDALTRPYDVSASAGRVRPPYTRALFERALTTGVDSGGTALVDAMPRFNLSTDEISDLWAFLDKLKDEHDPGVTADEIRIAAALPMSGEANPVGIAMFGVLEALAAQVNEKGGVHGRSLVFIPYDEPAGEPAPEDVFAVIGPHEPVPGVPTISSSFAGLPGPDGFALTSGQAEHEAALRAFAIQTWANTRIENVSCDSELSGTLVLSRADCADKAHRASHLLVPFQVFSQVSPETRKSWPASVHVALPLSVRRISRGAQGAFARTRSKSRFDSVAPIAEAEIYSAGVLSIEAMMRSGRGLSRSVFKEKIENIQGFVGAMTPPLAYSANDHIGANGAYIVSYDPKSGRLDGEGLWIDPSGEGG